MYCSPCIDEENKKNRNKIGAKMKTLEAKPFDQNVENWKRENRLFTSTVLEAGASGQNRIGTHALRSHRRSLIRFRCSNSCFLLETGIAGHERLSLAKWHPKAEKKLRKRPFFDTADRHEKLYGRSRLYASAQWRHETGGIHSLFSSLSFDISIKNSAQRWSSDFQGLFRVKIRKVAQGSNDLSTQTHTVNDGSVNCKKTDSLWAWSLMSPANASLLLFLHYELFFMRRNGLSILKACSYIFYLK